MNIPPKYEDLVLKVAEMERREVALREELELAKQVQAATDAIVTMVDGQRDRWIEKCGLLKQRLTVAEQRAVKFEGLLLRTNELLYQIQGDPGAVPSSAIDAMRGEVFTALKPAKEVEALGTRPVGCCCPPKGHTGIWAAAMCPVHFGLKRPGVSHDQ